MLPNSIKAFGIELKFLEKNDLPILYHWRNQPEIIPFLDVSSKISYANLAFWYEKIIKYKNALPWLVYYHDTPAAYAEIKEINNVNKSCVGGMFLFDEKYYGTGLSYRIVLCREIIMRRLGLETLFSHVRKNNQRSMDFCIQYGGELIGEQDGFNIYRYDRVKKEAKLKFIAKILKLTQEYETLLERG